MPFTTQDLQEALTACYVPFLRRDVVAAGLVRSTSLTLDTGAPGASIPGVPPRYIAQVQLTVPSSDDVLNAQLRAAIENRLLGLPQISQAEIILLPALFPILTGR